MNGNQAEEKERVKEGAEEKNESANQNGTGGEEEEEMEVEEEAEEHKAPVQKVVHTSMILIHRIYYCYFLNAAS